MPKRIVLCSTCFDGAKKGYEKHERRKVLQIRDRIKKMQSGFMPEKPKDAPCEHCGFTGMCDVKSTLASRFF